MYFLFRYLSQNRITPLRINYLLGIISLALTMVSHGSENNVADINPTPGIYLFAGMPDAGEKQSDGYADGDSSKARFLHVAGLAVDSSGSVYVADFPIHTIRKISPEGVVTTIAGSPGYLGKTDGLGSSARFFWPNDLAIDSIGNVYVADTGNSTVRKISLGNLVTTLAGTPNPWILKGGHQPDGSYFADGAPTTARFYNPEGVAVDKSGTVYVADGGNHLIRKITPEGEVSTLAGLAGQPGKADGNSTEARFKHPFGVAVDNTGNVYVTDSVNRNIRKITPAGIVSTLAGNSGESGNSDGPGATARFSNLQGLVLDNTGNIYVADWYNNTIRKITPEGVVSTVAGQAGIRAIKLGRLPGGLSSPSGLAIDPRGNLYTTCDNGRVVLKIVLPP